MKTTSVLPDFRCQYLCHSDINDYLDSLQLKYFKLVKVEKIGQTFEGRTLKSIRISQKINETINCSSRKYLKKNEQKPVILIDGGIHAREWCTISTALYCIRQLTEHSNLNRILLDTFDFVIVPIINADGYEYSRTIVCITITIRNG